MALSWGRSDSMAMACTYRFYDSAGRLLYVGVADDFDARWRGHMGKPWWPEVARKEVIWFDNRLDALYEESRAIALEHPIHNRREGISPVGLRIFRHDYAGRTRHFRGPLAVTRTDKAAAIDRVRNHAAHGVVTYDGEPVGLAVPIDWYLRAQQILGEPVDLSARPVLDWDRI